MKTNEAATIILEDLLGEFNPNFASAYVQIAYTDQLELDREGVNFNADSMRTILANVLAERTGTLATVVKAAIATKPQFCHFALMNHVSWTTLVNHTVSQCEAEIPSFEVAKTILMYPDCNKFPTACEYVLEVGDDVPDEFRAEFTSFFNETVREQMQEQENGN
ncbi:MULTISPECIES: hypothetical protein [Vibrio harveyi group]|uniref:hypothetical protein n=1 Tax=Vibrio harveyi group TaxID=717610 RepID=UPI001110333D|nr:hypothetical protein [Vibrio parahaemolyticus]MDG2761593.1 hypothetical protein [Vibrio parahaemolyticus]TMX40843.1 hypothetical protein DA098_03160 [Vibrio parahaemolyticus]TMX79852.1 hypothetical protein DA094_05040 [Vibrio parahaemolyticus]